MIAPIDLRSDTVTRPTAAMRRAMAEAEVGDDVFGEDPSVNLLQETVAALVGTEAALFTPTGSMANQIALKVHTHHGDEIIVGKGAHNWLYESGAAGALSGVQPCLVGDDGRFTAADVRAAFKADDHHKPPSRLVSVENTHNMGGGLLWDQDQVLGVLGAARELGMATHLDGARLWNAAAAAGRSERELAAGFDTVSVCLSKGLGAPVGSLLCGAKALIHRAHRYRKMFGGGMRQAGILAAAGLHALEHHRARLADDHDNARFLAGELCSLPGLKVDLARVHTNIVMVDVAAEVGSAADLQARAGERGVLFFAVGPARVRLVTHLDVDRAACTRAVEVLAALVRGMNRLLPLLAVAACSAPAVQNDSAAAEAQQRAGNDEAALRGYETAQATCKKIRDRRIRRDTCADAHIRRAELLEDHDRRAEAATAYEAVPRALEGDEVPSAKATYRAGRLRLALGEEERGYDLLWKTITEYPDVAYANDALRTLLADGRKRNPRQLYDVLAGLLESVNDAEIADAMLYAMADLAEHELASPAVAVQHLDRIAKEYPTGGLRDEAWWHGARLSRGLGDAAGAVARLRKLVATREVAFGIGSYFSIWLDDSQLEMGRILRDDLHDLPAAAAAFERLPRDYPASILRDDALYELAVTQEQAGRRDRACSTLARLRKDWPESRWELELAPAARTRLECRK